MADVSSNPSEPPTSLQTPSSALDSTPTKPAYVPDPTARFRGIGINFRAKLIGIDEVNDSRGDQMCQESLLKLKAAVKASGQHKQKTVVNVSLEGIKIIDQLGGQVEHVHPVHRISFISRDLTDRRSFGYVFGIGDGKHQFFGIKTQKVAETLVLALRDLFQVVYDMKKKEMETSKQAKDEGTITVTEKSAAQSNQEGGLLDLQKEINTIKEGLDGMEAFKPWPDNVPTSPDTPGLPLNDSNGDIFGANLSDISSLSSEFSCASNTIVDYGYAGGGRNGNNFVRTGSSRSAVSQGNQSLTQGSVSRSTSLKSKIIEENHSISEENGSINQDAISKTSSKESKEDFFSEVMNAAGLSSEIGDDVDEIHDRASSNSIGDSSSIDSKGTNDSKSSKKHSGFSGLFKSKSEKSKMKKQKKHGDIGSSMSSIGSKSEDEKKNHKLSKKPHQLSSTSLSAQNTPIKQRTLTANSKQDLERTESINSVQSCSPALSMMNNLKRGNSNASLVSAPDIMDKSKHRSSENISPAIANIERTKSSLVARPRPNAKHKSSPAEENPQNPPMFKNKQKNDSKEENINKTNNPNFSKTFEFQANWDELDDDNSFTNFNSNEKVQSNNDEHFDPFTGLSKDKLSTSVSLEGFADAPWPDDNTNKPSNLFPLSEEDPFADDPFKDEPVDNTDGINESTTPDPFEKIDPFQLDMDENENIFSDPFENVSLEDPFQDALASDQTLTEDTLRFKLDTCNTISSDELSSREPTFPEGSEEIMAVNKQHADSSSITSGLSTPIHQPSSPVENIPSLTETITPSISPPPLPPRLPPRRPKTEEIDINCPSMPPPPLPDNIEFEDDEDFNILPPDFSPPALPKEKKEINFDEIDNLSDEEDVKPPVIPQRKNSKMDNIPSWEHRFSQAPTLKLPPSAVRNKNLSMLPNVPHGGKSGKDSLDSTSSGSSCWPFSSHSSEERDRDSSCNFSSGSDATNTKMEKSDSYANDLMALNQPAKAAPGSKLSSDQILSGFGNAPSGGGMYAQQNFGNPGMAQPGMHGAMGMHGGIALQGGMQQPGFGMQQHMGMQQQMGMQQMPGGFGAQPGFNAGFPSGPTPAIPPRQGAMRPAPPQPAGMGAMQNPFGDSGPGSSLFPISSDNSLLKPASSQPEIKAEEEKKENDPFADLGFGSKKASGKDMFKDFKISKPMAQPEAPPRTSLNNNKTADNLGKSTSSQFDDYFSSKVGGMAVQGDDEANNNIGMAKAPSPAPRQTVPSNDPFGFEMGGQNVPTMQNDIFGNTGGNAGFDQPFNFNNSQNANNVESLFG